jgi:hypothetical protein
MKIRESLARNFALSTSTMARWTILPSSAAIPSGLSRPSLSGETYTRFRVDLELCPLYDVDNLIIHRMEERWRD